jgi:hypothetical protein
MDRGGIAGGALPPYPPHPKTAALLSPAGPQQDRAGAARGEARPSRPPRPPLRSRLRDTASGKRTWGGEGAEERGPFVTSPFILPPRGLLE